MDPSSEGVHGISPATMLGITAGEDPKPHRAHTFRWHFSHSNR